MHVATRESAWLHYNFFPLLSANAWKDFHDSHKRAGGVKKQIIRLCIWKSYAHEKCLMCRKKSDTRMNSPGIYDIRAYELDK